MSDSLLVDVQRASDGANGPADQILEDWVRAAIGGRVEGELVVRIVGEAESADLNGRFRGRPSSTNVLSFPAADDWPSVDGEPAAIGDLVICAPVLAREAQEQSKAEVAHWAHIVIHGVLHLLGYDHESEADAERMEAEERRLLAEFGIGDPYAEPASID